MGAVEVLVLFSSTSLVRGIVSAAVTVVVLGPSFMVETCGTMGGGGGLWAGLLGTVVGGTVTGAVDVG